MEIPQVVSAERRKLPVFGTRLRKLVSSLGLVTSALWLTAIPAAAQCILCYTSAASSGTRAITALRNGILVLLIPTILIFAAVVIVLVRRRNQDAASEIGCSREGVEEEEFLPLAPGH